MLSGKQTERGQTNRMINIGSHNVGRIAERIVANELEARGFRVSDLNKEGVAANADLVAISRDRMPLQIQVKGAANRHNDRWWVGYGYFTEKIVTASEPIFNRANSFYIANIVILFAVKCPSEYSCIVLPIDIAEKAAELHRSAFEARGWPHGKTHLTLEPGPRAKRPRSARDRRARAPCRIPR